MCAFIISNRQTWKSLEKGMQRMILCKITLSGGINFGDMHSQFWLNKKLFKIQFLSFLVQFLDILNLPRLVSAMLYKLTWWFLFDQDCIDAHKFPFSESACRLLLIPGERFAPPPSLPLPPPPCLPVNSSKQAELTVQNTASFGWLELPGWHKSGQREKLTVGGICPVGGQNDQILGFHATVTWGWGGEGGRGSTILDRIKGPIALFKSATELPVRDQNSQMCFWKFTWLQPYETKFAAAIYGPEMSRFCSEKISYDFSGWVMAP